MAFQGRLVAGVGKALRIYDIGKKKLLRKVENKVRQPFLRNYRRVFIVVADLCFAHHQSEYPGFPNHCRRNAGISIIRGIQGTRKSLARVRRR